MLSNKQKTILKIINDNANLSGSVLISKEIISSCTPKHNKINPSEVDKLINSLAIDGFFDVVNTYKKDQPFYCITLTDKGKNYTLVVSEELKAVKLKLTLTVACALISFLIGRILYLLFT